MLATVQDHGLVKTATFTIKTRHPVGANPAKRTTKRKPSPIKMIWNTNEPNVSKKDVSKNVAIAIAMKNVTPTLVNSMEMIVP